MGARREWSEVVLVGAVKLAVPVCLEGLFEEENAAPGTTAGTGLCGSSRGGVARDAVAMDGRACGHDCSLRYRGGRWIGKRNSSLVHYNTRSIR